MEDALKKQMERRKKKAEKDAAKAAKAEKQKQAEGAGPKDQEAVVKKETDAQSPSETTKPVMPVTGENADPNEISTSASCGPVENFEPVSEKPDPATPVPPAAIQEAATEVSEPSEASETTMPSAEATGKEQDKPTREALSPPKVAEEPNSKRDAAIPPPPPAPKLPEENMDSDLQAKLAARRARAEDQPAPDPVAGKARSRRAGKEAVVEDSDLQAKLAARRARAEGAGGGGDGGGEEVQEEKEASQPMGKDKTGEKTAVAVGQKGGQDEGSGGEEGRESLIKFLQAAGELEGMDGELAQPKESGVTDQGGDAEADSAALALPGHGAAMPGLEATFGEKFVGGRGRPWEAYTDEGMVDAIVNMYADREGLSKEGILGDAALMAAVEEAARFPGALGGVLNEALQGTDGDPALDPNFDPCKEVPVQWNAVAAAAPVLPDPPTPYSSKPITAPEPQNKPAGPTPTSIPVGGTSVEPPRPPEPDGPPCGVGMVLRPSTRNLYGTFKTHKRFVVEVESLLPNAPAALSGRILPGDVLLSVRNETDKVAAPVSNKVDEAKRLILGPAGSVVVLKLTRGDSSKNHTQESFDVALTRMPVLTVDRILKPADSAEPEQAPVVQDAIEHGDVVVSVDGLSLRQLQLEDVQRMLTGESSALVEVRVRKQSGELAAVRIPKHPVKRDLAAVRQLLRGAPPPPSPGAPPTKLLAASWQPPSVGSSHEGHDAENVAPSGSEKRLLGSRTLAKANEAVLGNLSKVNESVGGLLGKFGMPKPSTAEPESASTFPPAPPSRPDSMVLASAEDEPRTSSWAARPASASSQQSQPQASAGSAPESDLEAALRGGGLGGQLEALLPRLKSELGVECADDLRYVEEGMVALLALPPVQNKKLLQVVEDVKRTSLTRGAKPAAAAAAAAEEEEEEEEEEGKKEEEARAERERAAAEKAMLAQRILEEREQRKMARQRERQDALESAEEAQRRRQQQTVTVQAAGGEGAGPAVVGHCFAFHEYQAQAGHEVTLKAGEVVQVVRKHPSGWWEGLLADGRTGWFPSTFVKEYDPQAVAAPDQSTPYENAAGVGEDKGKGAEDGVTEGSGGQEVKDRIDQNGSVEAAESGDPEEEAVDADAAVVEEGEGEVVAMPKAQG